MSDKVLFWVFTSIGASLEIFGDIFFKQWAMGGKPILVWIGFVIYSVGALFWAYSLKYEMLAKAVSIFTVLNLVIVALVGILFFKENISLVSKMGIMLGILSIVLIELG